MMDFSFINELFIFCHLSIIGSHMILLSVIPEGMSGSETEFSLDKRLHSIIHHATQSRFQFHYIFRVLGCAALLYDPRHVFWT